MGTDLFGLIISIPLNYNPDHNKSIIAKLIKKSGFDLKPGDVCDAIHNLMHPDLKKDQSAMIQGLDPIHNVIKEICFHYKWVQMPNFSPSIKESESFILNINNGFYHVYKDYPLFKERDKYLFGMLQDWTVGSIGARYFKNIEYGCFMHLSIIEEIKFFDGEIRDSKESPCNSDFIEFMMEREEFTCSGYATLPSIHSQIVIKGLDCLNPKEDSLQVLEDWCYKSREWMSPLSVVSNEKNISCSWEE